MELNKENLRRFQNEADSLEKLKQEWKTKQAELENRNTELLQRIDQLSDELGKEKDEFKVLAIGEFTKTGEKKLIGGLGIRVGVELHYEEETAFDWAKEHKLCLQLNTREFEDIAKRQNLGFVRKIKKITATFPKEIKFEG